MRLDFSATYYCRLSDMYYSNIFLRIGATFSIIIFLVGCAAKQNITGFTAKPPQSLCIAKHEAVRESVLGVLQEGFQKHGTRTTVVRANYVEKHNAWNPTVNSEERAGCDAIVFYVANWTWDITTYMYFANIWITDRDMTRKIAQATYQTGGGPDKWINAREKLLELIDEMYASGGYQFSVPATPIAETLPKESVVYNTSGTAVPVTEKIPKESSSSTNNDRIPTGSSAATGDPVRSLQKLKELYEEGLIDEDEYKAEKQEILDTF